MNAFQISERESNKADRMVAIDAYLSGDYATAERLAKRCGLGRAAAKKCARALMAEGRIVEAVRVLTRTMSLDSAIAEIADAPRAQVGDILVCSWGYDQTNVDFYQVVSVSPNGGTCTIREIGVRRLPAGEGADGVFAVRDHFIGEPMTGKRVQRSTGGGGYSVLAFDGHHAHVWDGRPEYVTPSGMGH